MAHPLVQVDVFTERILGGNPLAVVLDADDLPTDVMAAIAREMNLSETAFVCRPSRPGVAFDLRIFTPGSEIPFAGHPVAGATWVLAHLGRLARPADGSDRVIHTACWTAAGRLPLQVHYSPDGQPVATYMDQLPAAFQALAPADLALSLSALGLTEDDLGLPAAAVAAALGCPAPPATVLAPAIVSTGLPKVILPLRNRAVLDRVRPDLAGLQRAAAATGVDDFYLVTTAPTQPRAHLTTRLFTPLPGVMEDPATGSAAGPLGAYLYAHDLAFAHLVVEQGVAMQRPALLHVQPIWAEGVLRMRVGGPSVLVFTGELAL